MVVKVFLALYKQAHCNADHDIQTKNMKALTLLTMSTSPTASIRSLMDTVEMSLTATPTVLHRQGRQAQT